MTSKKQNRFVGLLRAVNVGGKNKIKMAELRMAMEKSGLKHPRTYIQSGNLVFDSGKSVKTLTRLLKKMILEEFGHDIPVMVRPIEFIQKIVDENPFAHRDCSKLHAMILESAPTKSRVDAITQLKFGQDEFQVISEVVYVLCPNGYSKTKLTNKLFESKLQVASTARNWRTINKLIELGKMD